MANQDEGVDQYLKEIQEGSRDSTGTFTLDWEKARRRFEAEAKKDPYRYLICLFQFALSSAPPRVEIKADAKSLKLCWEPQDPTEASQLRRLLEGIKKVEFTPIHSRLNYLRQTLMCLAGRDDLSFTYNEAGVGCLDLSPTTMSFTALNSPTTFVHLSIQPGAKRLGNWSLWEIDLFHPVVDTHWPEVARLTKSLTHPNSRILLNGSLLRCSGNSPDSTFISWAEIPSTPQQARLGVLPNSLGSLWSAVVDEAGEERYGLPEDLTHYRALYLLGEFGIGKQLRTYRSQINLVQDGIVVHTCSGSGFGIVIFCATSGLPMDIDGLHAIECPEREEIVEHLRAQSIRLEERIDGLIGKLPLWRKISSALALAALSGLRQTAATEKAKAHG